MRVICRLMLALFLLTPMSANGARIIYVDVDANGANDGSSWTNAFNYLQDALATAIYGDEIQVAEGVYKPDCNSGHPGGTGDRNATFQLIDGVAVKGGYAGLGEPDPNACDARLYETILSGDLAGDDVEVSEACDLPSEPTRAENSDHVVTGNGTDHSAILDGFTITGGAATYNGGGMLNEWGSPTVGNCIFVGNWAARYMGGGMYNYFGSPKVTNCMFISNASAGPGGGMNNAMGGEARVANCVFSRNWTGDRGGGLYNEDSFGPTLTNCTFIGNSAKAGGGMFNALASYPVLTNCTFSGNSAIAHAGGILNDGYSLTLRNCILWGNRDRSGMGERAQLINYRSYWDLFVDWCCIQGWTGSLGGTGNMGADPCFLRSGYWDSSNVWVDGDYHLVPRSPCIDTADNNSLPADAADLDGDGNTGEPIPWDIDGNPRIVDGDNDGNLVVDMGAYEASYIEVAVRFTPQALNPGSGGRWVKAHFVLPEGFGVEDVDANRPAVIWPVGVSSDWINVFVNEEELVQVEAAFGRAAFCAEVPAERTLDVMGILYGTSGQSFYGIDTVKITNHVFEYLSGLASYWLEESCGQPDWCGGADLDQDSVVDFADFARFEGCCIEVVAE
jgi:hypothetical protein